MPGSMIRRSAFPALFGALLFMFMATPVFADEIIAQEPIPDPVSLVEEWQINRDADESALSVNEPMYLVIGGSGADTARFQFSFKYRIFDRESFPVARLPLLAHVYLSYTQTSLWDLGEDSSPFRDTSYRPSLFWQDALPGGGLMPLILRVGYEHESNGKDGQDSRGIDMLFVQPLWEMKFSNGRYLIFTPKLYGYIQKSGGNSDIQRYRGYVDWILRYGREDSWILATQLRLGTSGRGSAQFDVTYPLRKPLFSRTGGFLHLQVFKGYGESLLDYDRDPGTQVRVGFSIVR